MTDLNTAIAGFKGWKYNLNSFDFGIGNDVNFKYKSPDGKLQSKLPDFEHDARLYMALFEEMAHPGLRRWYDGWLCIPDTEEILEAESDTIGTAICIAYCKLNNIEV